MLPRLKARASEDPLEVGRFGLKPAEWVRMKQAQAEGFGGPLCLPQVLLKLSTAGEGFNPPKVGQ